MTQHLAPLSIAETLFGGPEGVSRIVGVTDKAVYHWRHKNTAREAGDMPSARVMRSLLAHAAAKGIPLKPEHLIWGAPAAEVEALLKQMAAASPEAAE